MIQTYHHKIRCRSLILLHRGESRASQIYLAGVGQSLGEFHASSPLPPA